jgi:hypothetical protein
MLRVNESGDYQILQIPEKLDEDGLIIDFAVCWHRIIALFYHQ